MAKYVVKNQTRDQKEIQPSMAGAEGMATSLREYVNVVALNGGSVFVEETSTQVNVGGTTTTEGLSMFKLIEDPLQIVRQTTLGYYDLDLKISNSTHVILNRFCLLITPAMCVGTSFLIKIKAHNITNNISTTPMVQKVIHNTNTPSVETDLSIGNQYDIDNTPLILFGFKNDAHQIRIKNLTTPYLIILKWS